MVATVVVVVVVAAAAAVRCRVATEVDILAVCSRDADVKNLNCYVFRVHIFKSKKGAFFFYQRGLRKVVLQAEHPVPS